jgi:hypothetical protein
MRASRLIVVVALMAASAGTLPGIARAATSGASAGTDPPRAADCTSAGPASVTIAGARVPAQALASATARRLDAQLGRSACRAGADAAIDALLRDTPGGAGDAAYLDAHRDLLDGRRGDAERTLRALLATEPGAVPATILLAQALLDRERRDEARGLLDGLAPGVADARAAVLRLRLAALDAPKGEGPARLGQVLRDAEVPPELREMAGTTLLYATALDVGQKEAALRELLRFDSPMPPWRKHLALGRFLAEDAGKPALARAGLQAVLDGDAPASGKEEARVLLAETWLLDAAAIAPGPTAANAEAVARAGAVLGGNLLPLATRVRQFHDLSALMPFVEGVRDPEARDAQHATALCRATQALDAAAVQAALDAGAAVDGECAGATPLAFVVRAGPADFARKRAVAERLLARGADPDAPMYPGSRQTARAFCGEDVPGCARELLPLLERAQAARGVPAPVR